MHEDSARTLKNVIDCLERLVCSDPWALYVYAIKLYSRKSACDIGELSSICGAMVVGYATCKPNVQLKPILPNRRAVYTPIKQTQRLKDVNVADYSLGLCLKFHISTILMPFLVTIVHTHQHFNSALLHQPRHYNRTAIHPNQISPE